MEVITILCTAAALSAAAGFRAFLPLFGLALVQRTGLAIPMADGFEWLSSDTALVVLGIACALEVAADKIPLLDNILDTIGLFVRPLAGATAAVAATSDLGGAAQMVSALSALALTGGIAGAKTAERGASTAATGGLANPVLSVKDDAVASGTVLAGFALPLLVPLILVAIFLVYRAAARRVAGVFKRRPATPASGPDTPPTPPGPPSSA